MGRLYGDCGQRRDLQEREQCFCREIAVTKDLRDDPGAERLARMGRHHSRAPIRMTEEVVAAPHSNNSEPGRRESRDEVGTGETRQLA